MHVAGCSDADGSDCLHLAVSSKLTPVVESLCQRGAVLDARDCSAEPALWQALAAGAHDVADVLVQTISRFMLSFLAILARFY